MEGGGYLLSIVPEALFFTQDLGPAKWGWGGEHKNTENKEITSSISHT